MSDARARCRAGRLALVAVLLLLGAGAIAVRLRSRTGDAIPPDGQGGAELAPATLPEGEGSRLAADPRRPDAPAMRTPPVPIEVTADPTSPTDLPTWKDVRFSLVDAITGRPLDASAVARPPSLTFGRVRNGLAPGGHARLRIEAAPGFVAAEPKQFDFSPELATVGVSLVYPLHRAIDLEVTVLDAAGDAVRDAELSVAMVGWVMMDVTESSGPGRFLLRNLPYEPRGPVFLHLSRPGPGQPEPTSPDEGWVPSVMSAESFTVRMPEDHVPRFEATVRIDRDRPREVGAGPALETPAARVPPRLGAVRVRVRRRDGSPAVGARVWMDGARVRVCDAEGVATLHAVDVGRRSVSLADPLLVPTTVTVDVRFDETTELELVEPEPAMLDVNVVDAEGKGVPMARVEVRTPSGLPALDLVDGVLRLDPYTDEHGRRTFTRVEPGLVKVTASARGWAVMAEVTLRPGTRSSVTMVLK